MLHFLISLFNLHGATEVEYTVNNEEIQMYSDSLEGPK